MAENLNDIIKAAGIKVDPNDKFRKRTNAEALAELLQKAIQDDIADVKEKASILADQTKARLKKEAAAAAKAAFEKSKTAARDAAKLMAQYEATKAYYQQASMRAQLDTDKAKYDKLVADLTTKIEDLKEQQADAAKRAARLEEENGNAGRAAELADKVTAVRTNAEKLRKDLIG